MGWFEGLVGGFSRRRTEVEAEERRSQELTADRERRVLEHLTTSTDPEVKSMAYSELLGMTGAPKQKGGLRGWVGLFEKNDALRRIQGLMQSPVQQTVQGLPSAPIRPARGDEPPQAPPVVQGRMGEPFNEQAAAAVQPTPPMSQILKPSPQATAAAATIEGEGPEGPPQGPTPYLPAIRERSAEEMARLGAEALVELRRNRAGGTLEGGPIGAMQAGPTSYEYKPRKLFPTAEDLARQEAEKERVKAEAPWGAKETVLRRLKVPEEEIRATLIRDIGGATGAAARLNYGRGPTMEIPRPDGTFERIETMFEQGSPTLLNAATAKPIPATARGATPRSSNPNIQLVKVERNGKWVYEAVDKSEMETGDVIPGAPPYTPPPEYGGMVPALDENGNVIFVRPKRGGGAPEVVPDVTPNVDRPDVAGAQQTLKTIDAAVKTRFGDPGSAVNNRKQPQIRAYQDQLAHEAGFDGYADVQAGALQPKRGPGVQAPVPDPGLEDKGVAADHARAREIQARANARIQAGQTTDVINPRDAEFLRKYREKYAAGVR